MNIKIFAFVAFIIGVAHSAKSDKKVVCYYQSWATYRQDNGKFEVSDITPEALSVCTHLVYTFFGLERSGEIKILDPYLDLISGKGNIAKFNALKKHNPHLKTLAAVGGWGQGSHNFSLVASDPIARSRFAASAVNFLSVHGFNGLSVDWIYPSQQDASPAIYKANYVELLKVLHTELNKNKTNLLLTASVSPLSTVSYKVPEIVKYLEFINVLTYDYHGAWEGQVGLNAPLYAGSSDYSDFQKTLNINSSVVHWLNEGAPANKIILSVPLYGRTFTLADPLSNGLGAVSLGPGHAGPYTRQSGVLGYSEVCENLGIWSVEWDNSQSTPYAYYDNQWISYDNERSLKDKAEYAVQQKLGGVMAYTIDLDDFKGSCGKRYPLLSTLARVLKIETEVPKPTNTSETSDETLETSDETLKTSDETLETSDETLETSDEMLEISDETLETSDQTIETSDGPTSKIPETSDRPYTSGDPSRPPSTSAVNVTEPHHRPEYQCIKDGMFVDPDDCAAFHQCENGVKYRFKCPSGLLFDELLGSCNYPNLVKC